MKILCRLKDKIQLSHEDCFDLARLDYYNQQEDGSNT